MDFTRRKRILGWLAVIGIVFAGFIGFDHISSNSFKINPNAPQKGSVTDALGDAEYNPADMIEIEGAAVAGVTDLSKILPVDYPIVQTFNNCPAAGLAIALSYYGINKTQEQMADALRPNWNLTGKNDDKSTPPERVAAEAAKYGLVPYYRANGSLELLKKFIANDTPILMRTLLNNYEDYHHYRVITGYDDATQEIIQDDSYYGADVRYKYKDFMVLWKEYNYEYIVLATKANRPAIEKILGAELNPMTSWKNAVSRAEGELATNPNDKSARFNLAVSLYHTKDYAHAVAEFEKIESSLSKYALWFRIEPIKAYFELKNDTRVFSLAEKIFAAGNLGYSELYLVRGQTHLRAGEKDLARKDFDKAIFYNQNLKSAQEALALLNAQ